MHLSNLLFTLALIFSANFSHARTDLDCYRKYGTQAGDAYYDCIRREDALRETERKARDQGSIDYHHQLIEKGTSDNPVQCASELTGPWLNGFSEGANGNTFNENLQVCRSSSTSTIRCALSLTGGWLNGFNEGANGNTFNENLQLCR